MKKIFLAAAVLTVLAACSADQAVPQNVEQSAAEPAPPSETVPQQPAASAPTGIDTLTGLGFIPDFAYAMVYDIADKNKEGVNRRRVLLEVLEGDIEAAMASAEATLARAGYSKSKESSDGGRYDAVFVKQGSPTLVFMAQSPDRGPDLKNPGAVGTIHVMWNTY